MSASDRGQLARNLVGYDISPTMAMLSTVNLFLHHQQQPAVSVYDTLTSEERWNDRYNVILANPPFMSPKGGIRPHGRFFSKSRRSEVLFVDYIMGHLNDGGRAGVIVPEGVIFQSQRAHTQLRRLLVETALAAVVSLPAGVFQPYSGVKTSILILDKAAARRADGIAFFKVENDGYDLGAQRRPIERNDLPAVQAELTEYLRRLRVGESLDGFAPATGLVVAKGRIADGGDYNLSGERYRENGRQITNWPVVALGNVAEVIAGQSPPGHSYNDYGSGTPFHQGKTEFGETFIGEPVKWTTEPKRFAEHGDIVMSVRAPVGPVNLTGGRICIGRGLAAIRPAQKRLLTRYAFYLLRSMESEINGSTGAAFASINKQEIQQIEIPLPPLEMQRELVAEIEGYQRVIDGARAVVDNWRPRIAVDPEWPLVELGGLTKPQYGYTASAADEGDARFVRITDIADDGTLRPDGAKFLALAEDSRKLLLSKGDLLVARTGATYGKTMLFNEDYPAVFASYLIRLRFDPGTIEPGYFWAFAQSEAYWNQARALSTGGGQPQFNGNAVKRIKLPVPPLATQQVIVAEIEAERGLVSANRELAARMAGRIAGAVGRVWYDGSNG